MLSHIPRADAIFRRITALVLCLLTVGSGLAAQTAAAATARSSAGQSKVATQRKASALDPEQRIVHLLNRFTFGPTPDGIARVRKLGIDRWFDEQLHPARIADPVLDARLTEFPALQLPVEELLYRFPDGAAVRQAANGKQAIPGDRTLASIYARHIDLYEQEQAEKAAGQGKANEPKAATAAAASQTDPARPAYADLLEKTILALPPAARVNRILAMQPAAYDQFHAALKGPQKLSLIADMSAPQREFLADFDNPTRAVVEELQAQRLLRDIYSERQLQEVMTSFWLNHFNVYLHKNEQEPYYLVSYERDVIRPRALGNFEDLLIATAESPAMLLYLDNSASTGPDSAAAERQKQRAVQGKAAKATPPGLNENYARELMELHTLGVNGGYTQKDVTEVAKVFTGWTVDKPGQGGSFEFDETRHEPGSKLVMGHKIKDSGQKEGLQLLHLLSTSPSTAHFIAQELAVAFVSDAPPPALVNHMARRFLSSHGNISTVLKTMMHAPEFWAPAAYQAKVKTPLEYVVSAARASGAEITSTQPLVNALNQMGMPLYACVPPTGYSAKAEEWVSTGALVTRMNFALSLATNHYSGVKTNWKSTNSDAITPESSEHALEARLIPTGISEQTRTAALTQTQSQTSASPPNPAPGSGAGHVPAAVKPPNPAVQAAALERQNAQLAGLLLGSPEFQRR